jgi:hypothetical protein
MQQKIKKYLLKIWLLTFIFSGLSTFILVHLIEINRRIDNRCYMPYFTEVGFTIFSMILTFCFSTIFLNLNKKISQNRNLNLLSFFLLPAICVLIFATFLGQDTTGLKYLFATVIPFLLLISFYYYKFRKLAIEKEWKN